MNTRGWQEARVNAKRLVFITVLDALQLLYMCHMKHFVYKP